MSLYVPVLWKFPSVRDLGCCMVFSICVSLGAGEAVFSKRQSLNVVFKPQQNRGTFTLGTAAPPSQLTGIHFIKPGALGLQPVVHTARHLPDAAGVRVTGCEWWCLGLRPRASAHLASRLPLSHIVTPHPPRFIFQTVP